MTPVNVSLFAGNATTGIAQSTFFTTTTAGVPSVTSGNTSDSASTLVAVTTSASLQTTAVITTSTTTTTTTTQIPQNFSNNITQATVSNSSESVCLNILYEDVGSSRYV